MNNLTPDLVQVVERYADGEDAIHFTFLLPKERRN